MLLLLLFGKMLNVTCEDQRCYVKVTIDCRVYGHWSHTFTVMQCGSIELWHSASANVSSLEILFTNPHYKTMMLFDPRKKRVHSTLTTTISTITLISFYQFSGNTINSPVWQNTKPALKLWPCTAALLVLIKRWGFCFTCPNVSNEDDSGCRQKLPSEFPWVLAC